MDGVIESIQKLNIHECTDDLIDNLIITMKNLSLNTSITPIQKIQIENKLNDAYKILIRRGRCGDKFCSFVVDFIY